MLSAPVVQESRGYQEEEEEEVEVEDPEVPCELRSRSAPQASRASHADFPAWLHPEDGWDRRKKRREERFEAEIEEEARRAFMSATGERVRRLDEEIELPDALGSVAEENVKRIDSTRTSEEQVAAPAVPTFQRKVKEKKAPALLPGVKKKPVAALVAYDDDEEDDD